MFYLNILADERSRKWENIAAKQVTSSLDETSFNCVLGVNANEVFPNQDDVSCR